MIYLLRGWGSKPYYVYIFAELHLAMLYATYLSLGHLRFNAFSYNSCLCKKVIITDLCGMFCENPNAGWINGAECLNDRYMIYRNLKEIQLVIYLLAICHCVFRLGGWTSLLCTFLEYFYINQSVSDIHVPFLKN
jgi:hypothetical protein